MKKADVFLSYEHSMRTVVEHICSVLEADGISCWYAPRDVMGDYATSIVDAIDNARVFVVVLNGAASQSAHVLNEVEIAYKRILDAQDELAILPFKLNDDQLSKAMEYYIKRLHWIEAGDQGIDKAIEELKTKIAAIVRPGGQSARTERTSNRYYDESDADERKRLKTQRQLLERFDKPVYDAVCASKGALNVLDLGCGNGSFAASRLAGKEVGCMLGVDCNEGAIQSAIANFGAENVEFRLCDLESDDLCGVLEDFCSKRGVKFDLINLSMILLHLKDPLKVLKTARKFAAKDAAVIVKDIDDGLNLAYPDESVAFAEAMRLCAASPWSGFRQSGRQVPYLLKKAGYRDVALVKCGLDTLGMDYDDRQALFDTYFSIIKQDYRILSDTQPDNDSYRLAQKWIDQNYNDLEDAFHEENFFFSLGFMLFTAKR